jgi:hypothetical protein
MQQNPIKDPLENILEKDKDKSKIYCAYVVDDDTCRNFFTLMKENELDTSVKIPIKYRKYIPMLLFFLANVKKIKSTILKIRPLTQIYSHKDSSTINIGDGLSLVADKENSYNRKRSLFGELLFGEDRGIEDLKENQKTFKFEFSSKIAVSQLRNNLDMIRLITGIVGENKIWIIVRYDYDTETKLFCEMLAGKQSVVLPPITWFKRKDGDKIYYETKKGEFRLNKYPEGNVEIIDKTMAPPVPQRLPSVEAKTAADISTNVSSDNGPIVWNRFVDQKQNLYFYQNQKTNDVQWNKPTGNVQIIEKQTISTPLQVSPPRNRPPPIPENAKATATPSVQQRRPSVEANAAAAAKSAAEANAAAEAKSAAEAKAAAAAKAVAEAKAAAEVKAAAKAKAAAEAKAAAAAKSAAEAKAAAEANAAAEAKSAAEAKAAAAAKAALPVSQRQTSQTQAAEMPIKISVLQNVSSIKDNNNLIYIKKKKIQGGIYYQNIKNPFTSSESVPNIKDPEGNTWYYTKDTTGNIYFWNKKNTSETTYELPTDKSLILEDYNYLQGNKKYYNKYLKYKQKYLEAKKLHGDKLHGDKLHGDKLHDKELHDKELHDKELHDKELHDKELQYVEEMQYGGGEYTFILCPKTVLEVLRDLYKDNKKFNDIEFFKFITGPRSFLTNQNTKKLCFCWGECMETFWEESLGLVTGNFFKTFDINIAKQQINNKIINGVITIGDKEFNDYSSFNIKKMLFSDYKITFMKK